MIPERKDLTDLPEKPRRFYVFAAPSAVVELQREAVSRCTDAWKLGGLVIEQWIKAGCPDQITPREDSIQ